jgi:RecA-family ATPase
VITTPTVSLDLLEDQERLRATVARLQPTLLVLDPFVRLHRIDENASTEVAPVLAYLRDLERHFHTAVLLVHHARAAHVRAGQALRGSSELHAWGDSLSAPTRRDAMPGDRTPRRPLARRPRR